MRWYDNLIRAHAMVTDAVGHGSELKLERYFVWTESVLNGLYGDDILQECVVTGSTDLYTPQEFDPWIEELEAAFAQCDIAFTRDATMYEDSTNSWHTVWYWQVLDGREEAGGNPAD